jgi:Flp pilus assembly pilin Flp
MIMALSRSIRDQSGAAAAEMALMLPLLTLLLFGGVEMGSFFWTEHQVIKSVRNGTRFAARQDFSNFACDGTDVGLKDTEVRNLIRTGTVDGSGDPVIRTWTAADDGIEILVTCDTASTYSSGGIYADQSGAAAPAINSALNVQVAVTLPYPSLFENLGYLNGQNITARAQSPVTGF